MGGGGDEIRNISLIFLGTVLGGTKFFGNFFKYPPSHYITAAYWHNQRKREKASVWALINFQKRAFEQLYPNIASTAKSCA